MFPLAFVALIIGGIQMTVPSPEGKHVTFYQKTLDADIAAKNEIKRR